MLWSFLWDSEISHVLPALEAFHKVLDQQLSPGIGQYPKQVGSTTDSLPTCRHTKKSLSLSTISFFFRFVPIQVNLCPLGLSNWQNCSTQ